MVSPSNLTWHGRAAPLPASLRSKFRPVSVEMPDVGAICELMFLREGFQLAKELASKCRALYEAAPDLMRYSDISKHVWGFRRWARFRHTPRSHTHSPQRPTAIAHCNRPRLERRTLAARSGGEKAP